MFEICVWLNNLDFVSNELKMVSEKFYRREICGKTFALSNRFLHGKDQFFTKFKCFAH